MTLRARLRSDGGSPLQVLTAGADPNNPGLDEIIFDANHSTLRLLQKGAASVPSADPIPPFQGGPFWWQAMTVQIAVAPGAGGRRPLIYAMGYEDRGIPHASGFPKLDPSPGRYVAPFINAFVNEPWEQRGIGIACTPANLWLLNWGRSDAHLLGYDESGQPIYQYTQAPRTIHYMAFHNTAQ